MEFSATMIGIIIAIIGHGWASIWWASKIDTTLNYIKTDLEKRDAQIASIWKRIDELRDLIDSK